VEEIGKIAQMGRYGSMSGGKRVIILDEAQRISSAAQNLLLKDFEDSAKNTIWIICTTEPTKILLTLRRRCMAYALKPLGFDAKEKLLQRAAKACGCALPLEPLLEAANEAQVSAPAMLLMAMEKYAAGVTPKEAVATVDAPTDFNSLALCKAVTSGSFSQVRAVLKDAAAEDSRFIRASVCGWLRGCLLRENNPKRQTAIANSLRELASGTAPLEDAMMLWWLWGVLHRVCGRFKV
jgi:DNA polymerase III gamma/tau subunit